MEDLVVINPNGILLDIELKQSVINVDTPANINNNLMCFTWTAILIIVDLTI